MEVMRVREDTRVLDGRVEIDDAYLGGERSGGKSGRGSENKVPFIAAVQTTPAGQPELVCLRQQPFTHEEVATFAARSIAPSATVVSDGLWCFVSVQLVGAEHERIVTGGGKASTKLPQFKAVNTFLGNLKRALGGTYHAFDFAKYAHRYLAPLAFPLQPPRTSFVRLRLVANQVEPRANDSVMLVASALDCWDGLCRGAATSHARVSRHRWSPSALCRRTLGPSKRRITACSSARSDSRSVSLRSAWRARLSPWALAISEPMLCSVSP
jgi:hypothetical protein